MGQAKIKDMDDGSDTFVDELPPGTELMHGQYTITSFLNAGGFGITYNAKDSLDRKVVIKECFPGAFCRRSRAIVQARSRAHQPELESIVRLFVQEARSLAKLKHPNIVGVHQVFEDNNTAYMALDFVEGRDLLDVLDDPESDLTAADVKKLLTELLGAVGFIHDQDMLHRDISPDNILLSADMRPVLIDFGAAREQATKQSRVLSALRVVKDGYSPQEFYISGSEQGPYSDLYALGASFYHLISGETPPNSQARLAAIASGEADPYKSLIGEVVGFDDNFLKALDKALAVVPKDRVQSADEWLAIMEGRIDAGPNVVSLKTEVAPKADPFPELEKKPKGKMVLLASVAAIVLLGVGVATQTDLLGGGETDGAADVNETAGVATEPEGDAAVETDVAQDIADIAALLAAQEEGLDTGAPDGDGLLTEDAAAETAANAADEDIVASLPVDPRPLPPVETSLRPQARPDLSIDVPASDDIATLEPGTNAADDALDAAIASVDDGVSAPLAPVLPTPLNTPQILAEPTDQAELAARDAQSRVPQDVPSSLALPSDADETADIVGVTQPDVEAVVIGNEILQRNEPALAENSSVLSGWRTELPYQGLFSTTPNETRIFAVNGIAVNNEADFNAALRETVAIGDQGEVAVTVETGTVGQDTRTEQSWTLPVVQETVLLNGARFLTTFEDTAWVTRVASTPDDGASDLAVGDVILAYVPTSERIDQRTSLKSLFERELPAGRTDFSLAVQREGSTWLANLTLPPLPTPTQ